MKHRKEGGVHQIRIAFLWGGVMFAGRMPAPEENTTLPPTYRWPYFVGGFVILWIVLTVAWMVWGVGQTQRERELRQHRDAFGLSLIHI